MPIGNNGGKQKRRNVPNVSQRRGGSKNSPAMSGTPRPLPPQYNFTPASQDTPTPPQLTVNNQPSTSAPNVRSFPPPQQLFQNSGHQHTGEERRAANSAPVEDPPASPLQAQSQPSSQGHNFDDEAPVLPDLQEDTMRALNALLMVPDRHLFTTVLSPTKTPNSKWFTRDKGSKLVRAITKVFTNKFDGPYYSWTCVPRDRQERYFMEFAKTHTWDPLITGTVKGYFDEICQRRMKDMVSSVRVTRVRPNWICDTLWTTMTDYWDTEDAKARSATYSDNRMSDREGLGPHIHLSGPTSYQQIQDALEEELGRPVSLGEVFKKTHTKPDGTYVDRKAEKIIQTYEQKVQEKLTELQTEASVVSDGASPPRELTVDDCTTIFLQSTAIDSRGTPYGVGSLKVSLLNGKRKQPGDSSAFVAMQEQLKEAQKKIQEQAAYNERRDAEVAAREAEQKTKLEHFSLVEKYLRQTDPHFLDFLASHSTPAPTEPNLLPSTSQPGPNGDV